MNVSIENIESRTAVSVCDGKLGRGSRRLRAASTLLLGAATSLNGAGAFGQEAASQGSVLEEITVTARYREENLQETPLAITALSAATLQDKSFTNISEIAQSAPNAFFRQAPAYYGRSTQAYIRGVGQNDFKLSFEPGVAMYVDDVYHATVLGSVFDLMDLERVEILRGPQGTLFGKNAIGGAVRMISKRPTGDNSGYIEVTGGRYNRVDVRAGYDFPLIEDKMYMRLSVVSKKRDGYQEQIDFTCDMIRRGTPQLAGIGDGFGLVNGAVAAVPVNSAADNALSLPSLTPGAGRGCKIGEFGGEDLSGARAMLRYEVTDRLELNFSADYTDDNSPVQADTLVAVGRLDPVANRFVLNTTPTTPTGLPPAIINRNSSYNMPRIGVPFDSRFITGDPYKTYHTFQDLAGNQTFPAVSTVESWGLSGTMDFKVSDDIGIKWINAYRTYDALFSTDNDFSPVHLALVNTIQTHEQITSELQVSGIALDRKLDWTAGLFYFDSDSFNGGRVITANGALNFNVNDDVSSSNKSAFVHLVYHMTDRLGFTAGARYSEEEKTYSFDHLPYLIVPTPIPADLSREDWKVGADFKFTDDVMAYAQVSTGFRSPGFNPRPFTARQLEAIPEESLTAYEVGVKSDFFDNRVRMNAAVFYSDYENRVISRQGTECLDPGAPMTLPQPPCGTVISWFQFFNGPANIRGAELEVRAELIDNLSVDAAVGYNTFSADDLTIGGIERQLVGIPEWNGNLGVQYELPLGDGSLTPRLDGFYQSVVYNDALNQDIAAQPGFETYNARVTYKSGDQNWSVALAVTNLTDKFYYTTMTDLISSGGGALAGQPSRPREWALTVRRSF
jgi:iron complex outermembrane receptor protein